MELSRSRTPTELFRELGLFDKTNNDPKLPDHRLTLFDGRKIGFDWVHMGTSALTVGALLRLIKTTRSLSVPRTGHFGNWVDIANGRAGMLDYNNAVCGEWGLGYPLILDFNQTEDDALEAGDWIYMPGSVISRGERRVLKLFTWDGSDFVARDRRVPYFCPFVMTQGEDGLTPLTELHRGLANDIGQFTFRYQSSFLRQHEERMRDIFHALIEVARVERDGRALQRVFDRFVGRDGRVSRDAVEFDGEGFRFGDVSYAGTAALVEAALVPFRAAAEPRWFFSHARDIPQAMPLASAPMIGTLLAILNSHYPDVIVAPETMTRPCNPHVHWGALGMAGYPPKNRGYFFTNVSKTRKLHQAIVERFSDIDPVFFVLLPAAIFSLCPSSAHPSDVDLVTRLIATIHSQTGSFVHKPNLMVPEVEKCTWDWVSGHKAQLSRYFVDRFRRRRTVLTSSPSPEFSRPVAPEGFADLTLQQASMIVGFLHEAMAEG